ncbi:TlpA disulfide reductase family protein [Pseudoduganella sp. LjRoot289]|uniref:TlpA disulfide reductase family protein n=1 Tax=Pseudoduganella sp. LjRoot289 TaxID=3342314 RepID=UPI003ECE05EE
MFNKKYFVYAAVAIACGAGGAWFSDMQAQQALAEASAAKAASMAALPPPVAALFRQQLKDVKGADQSLGQWRGKGLLVNFWATWCAPCVQEMPELSALQAEIQDKKLQIIGIGIDSPSNIAEFAEKHKIAYPVYVGGMSGTDLSRELGNAHGGLPFTVLIGADGRVKKTYLGRLKFDELRADLASM